MSPGHDFLVAFSRVRVEASAHRATGEFIAAFFDGHVQLLPVDIDPATFKAMVTPAGGCHRSVTVLLTAPRHLAGSERAS